MLLRGYLYARNKVSFIYSVTQSIHVLETNHIYCPSYLKACKVSERRVTEAFEVVYR
jgi:hypothetical protein